jgi:hypothetical protein
MQNFLVVRVLSRDALHIQRLDRISESPSVRVYCLSPLKIRQGIVIPWLVLSLSRVVVDVIKDVAN